MSQDTDDTTPTPKSYKAPVGTFDILPDEQLYYTYIKKVLRHRCRQSGFRRITTPTYEFTDLFADTLGNTSDIVEGELFEFENERGHQLALRPDSTPAVARAYVQHKMKEWPQPVELFYIEPHFRQGRRSGGSFHQFNQFGYEVIGESDPALDAQVIQLSHKILEDLGVAHLFEVQINHVGSEKARTQFVEELKNFYIGKERSLPAEAVKYIETNPIRLLELEDEDAKILAQLAPKISQFYTKADQAYSDQVKTYLTEMGVNYAENEMLFRGIDYYTQTVFEFWDPSQGSQAAVGGGGRYDGLVEKVGGEPTPAVGASFGFERLIYHMKREKIEVPSKDNLHIFVAQLGDDAKKKCLNLIWDLRERGVKTVGALGKGSVKDQLRLAMKFDVPYSLILGITEVREGTIIIRNMAKGQQRTVPFDTVVDEVIQLIGEDNLDTYSPGELVFT